LHKFCKENRRSPRDCFECGDTMHSIVDYLKRKELDSYNNYNNNNNQNDSNDKGDSKKKYCFGDKKKKKF
jgi:hypothetical protein